MKSNDISTGSKPAVRHHIQRKDWLKTPAGDARGYIDPHTLRELWFHTGTRCNLGCWFCLEGSGPKADRIEFLTYDDSRRFIDEAVELGVEQFCFTGGEPFVNIEMIAILDYALQFRPCLVLTNGTSPLRKQMKEIYALADKPNPLKFRVSLDFPDAERHDEGRGGGSFDLAVDSLKKLHRAGFAVSIARHAEQGESVQEVNEQFARIFDRAGLPPDTNIIAFPELYKPGDQVEVPHITENCMTTYKNERSRADFMCAFSKMIVKIDGRARVYACTLVDDDTDYALGETLRESMEVRVMLKHHRCYACFAAGASCSE